MRASLSPFGILIFLFSFPEQTIAKQDVCPSWFFPDNTSITGCYCYQCVSSVYQRRRKDFLIGGGTVCNKLLCSTEHIWNRLKTWGGAHAPGATLVPTPMSTVVQILHFSILATVWLTIIQLGLLSIHWTLQYYCVEGVSMAMAFHYTYTLCSAVSAGDMVMDGSCTISWNLSQ